MRGLRAWVLYVAIGLSACADRVQRQPLRPETTAALAHVEDQPVLALYGEWARFEYPGMMSDLVANDPDRAVATAEMLGRLVIDAIVDALRDRNSSRAEWYGWSLGILLGATERILRESKAPRGDLVDLCVAWLEPLSAPLPDGGADRPAASFRSRAVKERWDRDQLAAAFIESALGIVARIHRSAGHPADYTRFAAEVHQGHAFGAN